MSVRCSRRVRVIEALVCVCDTRQPVSTLMKRWLRAEPTQLLQGIVGSCVIAETFTAHRCLEVKYNLASLPILGHRCRTKTCSYKLEILCFRCFRMRRKKWPRPKKVRIFLAFVNFFMCINQFLKYSNQLL